MAQVNLPPGFVLDKPSGLPPGFVLDDPDPAPASRGGLFPLVVDSKAAAGMSSDPSMAKRAGLQVLAPINAQAAGEAIMDASRVAMELPGAVMGVWGDYAGGALKGLGGIVDSGIKALGLPRSDYADAAFEPSNPVQSVGKGAAQMGTMVLGTEAALAGMGLSPLGSLIAKFITSPVGAGTT